MPFTSLVFPNHFLPKFNNEFLQNYFKDSAGFLQKFIPDFIKNVSWVSVADSCWCCMKVCFQNSIKDSSQDNDFISIFKMYQSASMTEIDVKT